MIRKPMANNYNRCISPLVIRKMQIKTTLRDIFTPPKLAKIEKFDNIKG